MPKIDRLDVIEVYVMIFWTHEKITNTIDEKTEDERYKEHKLYEAKSQHTQQAQIQPSLCKHHIFIDFLLRKWHALVFLIILVVVGVSPYLVIWQSEVNVISIDNPDNLENVCSKGYEAGQEITTSSISQSLIHVILIISRSSIFPCFFEEEE